MKRSSSLGAALLLVWSTGAHWALLQAGAWVAMGARAVVSGESVAEAMATPCGVCITVSESAGAEDAPGAPRSPLRFASVHVPVVDAMPAVSPLPAAPALGASGVVLAPRTPPPRPA